MTNTVNFGTSFHAYLKNSEEEEIRIWSEAFIVFDSSVLLDFYRVKGSTRRELFRTFDQLSSRIRIPFYTGIEFFENRPSVIRQRSQSISDIEKQLLSGLNGIRSALERGVSGRRAVAELRKDWQHRLRLYETAFKGLTASAREDLVEVGNDEVLEHFVRIFSSGVVCRPFSQDEIAEMDLCGQERFDRRIPPGYADMEKLGVRVVNDTSYQLKFGDLYFWEEVIRISKNENKDVVLVTSDMKEDWWQVVNERRIGPLPSLLFEFTTRTGKSVRIVQFDTFLGEAGRFLDRNVMDDAVRDVANLDHVREKSFPGWEARRNIVSPRAANIGFDNQNIDPVIRWVVNNRDLRSARIEGDQFGVRFALESDIGGRTEGRMVLVNIEGTLGSDVSWRSVGERVVSDTVGLCASLLDLIKAECSDEVEYKIVIVLQGAAGLVWSRDDEEVIWSIPRAFSEALKELPIEIFRPDFSIVALEQSSVRHIFTCLL